MTSGWAQSYLIFGQGLGVSALIATIPTLLLLFLLAAMRKPAWVAALSGLIAAMVLASIGYGMSAKHVFSSAAYGACFGIFPISWIVFWALVLYEITVSTGKFEVIKESIGSITSDRRMQALLIAFAFGAFIEGCAGFGTPVAVAAAMMVGLGFSSFYASSICLLANTAPVAFGSIGIPVITLAGITGLPLNQLSGSVGSICAPISLFLPAYLILVTSGLPATLEVWPAVLSAAAPSPPFQFFVSNFIGPQLTDIIASTRSHGRHSSCCSASGRRARNARIEASPTSPSHLASLGTPHAPAHTRAANSGSPGCPTASSSSSSSPGDTRPSSLILNKASISFPWPGLHNEILRTPPVVQTAARYAAIFNFNWLSASGTSCMFASLLAAIFSKMSLARLRRHHQIRRPQTHPPHHHRRLHARHGLRHELQRSHRHPRPRLLRHRRACSPSSARSWAGSASSSPAPTPPPTRSSATCRSSAQPASASTPSSSPPPTPPAESWAR